MLDEPIANSSRLALPRNTAPSRSRLALTVLSYGGTKGDRILLPAVVRTPCGAEQILDRERNARERPPLPARERRIRRIRLRQRLLCGHGDEGVQPRVEPPDRRQMRLGQRARGELAPVQPGAGGGDGQIGQHHSTTFGTT